MRDVGERTELALQAPRAATAFPKPLGCAVVTLPDSPEVLPGQLLGRRQDVAVIASSAVTARFALAVPVLQVADVSRSMAWYSDVLGFSGWGFPKTPPHVFALVARDGAELMFQRAVPSSPVQGSPRPGMAAYLRIEGGQLLDLAAAIERSTPLLRKPQRMPYGDVELALVDPDGHVIVVGELLPPDVDVPIAEEGADEDR